MINILLAISLVFNVVLSISLAVFIRKYKQNKNQVRLFNVCAHK